MLAIGALQIYAGIEAGGDNDTLLAASTPTAVANSAPAPASDVAALAAPSQPVSTIPPAARVDRDIAFAEPVYGGHFTTNTNDGLTPVASAPGVDSGGTGSVNPASSALTPITVSADPALPPASQLPLDLEIGSQRLTAAALDGDPTAAFEIGVRYAEGRYVPVDLTKSAAWYRRAAEDGVAVAQYRLASLYERGRGVAKNVKQAVAWYRRAADQGNINAMHNLAVLLSQGVDGQRDEAKALEWFLSAAGYGVRDSQYNLGVIYARGVGTPPNLVESYKWFAAAAKQGDADAAARRDEVAAAMTKDELARARVASQAFSPRTPIIEANAVAASQDGWDGPQQVVSEADQQALVMKIQTLLAEQGYDPGPADGVPGPRTLQAVKEFQRTLGAPQTGQIDKTLLAALGDGER